MYTNCEAVVVAQVVERWHSVRSSQVWIPGRIWLFYGNAINLFSLGVGLYLKKTGHRKCYILFLLLSCSLSYKRCVNINCIVPMNQRKENKSPKKRPGKCILIDLFKRQAKFLGAKEKGSQLRVAKLEFLLGDCSRLGIFPLNLSQFSSSA